jgi:anti-sigma factor RsiW
MMPWNRDDAGPPPELLAAYADGELDAEQTRAVEAWLASHPEAAADVEGQRRLAGLVRQAAPAEPAQANWDAVRARIEGALAGAARKQRRRRLLPWVMLTAAAAAAVLLAVLLPRPTPTAEPFPIVSADDVEIVSLDADAGQALVVGEPPVREALALLGPHEVEQVEFQGNVDGMDPLYLQEGAAAPMIIMMPREPDVQDDES